MNAQNPSLGMVFPPSRPSLLTRVFLSAFPSRLCPFTCPSDTSFAFYLMSGPFGGRPRCHGMHYRGTHTTVGRVPLPYPPGGRMCHSLHGSHSSQRGRRALHVHPTWDHSGLSQPSGVSRGRGPWHAIRPHAMTPSRSLTLGRAGVSSHLAGLPVLPEVLSPTPCRERVPPPAKGHIPTLC